MEELFHLYLGLVELLKDRFNVADGAIVWSLIVGNSRVPVARQRVWLKLSFKAGKRARTTHLWEVDPSTKGWGVCNPRLFYSLKSCHSWAWHKVWTRGIIFSCVMTLWPYTLGRGTGGKWLFNLNGFLEETGWQSLFMLQGGLLQPTLTPKLGMLFSQLYKLILCIWFITYRLMESELAAF